MNATGTILLRVLGLVLGLAAAVSLVLVSRIPPGTGTLGADVIIAAAPTGELGVSPTGPFLSATNLSPGGTDIPAGILKVTNQTGIDLHVQVRGLPSSRDLDDVLRLRVATDDEPIFEGTLGELRTWSSAAFTLASGETGDVEVRTWIDPTEDEGWSGRMANVALEFRSAPIGGSA